ncbi:MAG: DUF2828 family protein [Oscillospiraceae bacterium]|nr:DUF2828 family protein [Oscillospiraceae bacterium]
MLEFLKREANKTYTENGAVTYRSTGRDCLDLFATIGALRRESEQEITARFLRAYEEDPDLAMKILFYGRDVRGGLGERRVFRILLRWLAVSKPDSVVSNLPYIAEYGRWDDVLVLLDTPCRDETLALLKQQFDADLAALGSAGEVSLLGKWLPSVNASNDETVRAAKQIANAFGLSDRDYRKALTMLRAQIRILENNLREKDYTFDYSKQPSKAMFKYRKAFLRNDSERYGAFMQRVSSGEAKLNTGALYPYEIIEKAYHCDDAERLSLDATWRALADYTQDENALVVADGSGSMYWGGKPMPAAVAQSLAIYFAEHNRGAFHNHFITFSMNPRLVEIKGRDIVDKARYCETFNECANTNIQKVFELVLNAAVRNRVSQKDLPATLYIISDMEFDLCAADASLTNFERAAKMFQRAGYRLPNVVFWNVSSRNQQQPVTMNEQGVALVSGCSPRIFSMVMEGTLDPFTYMLSVIDTERYAQIKA